MKQFRSLLVAILAMVATFSAVLYTSCHKDPCSNVHCNNGGYCSGGGCVCAAGYEGSRCDYLSTTAISFHNNTQTRVTLAIAGYNTVYVDAGSSVVFDGYYTDQAIGTATTGSNLGEPISWNLTYTFPSTGELQVNINVSSDYFYLYLRNNTLYTITEVNVNYLLTGVETDENTIIPYDGNLYGIGYYQAYTNSNLYFFTNGRAHQWSYNTLSLPFTDNQTFTAALY